MEERRTVKRLEVVEARSGGHLGCSGLVGSMRISGLDGGVGSGRLLNAPNTSGLDCSMSA